MRALVKAVDYEVVAMHFRNAYIARSKRDSKGVLDEYHQRCNCESLNEHVKVYYGLKTKFFVVGKGAITRTVLWTFIAMHIVTMVYLQHGVIANPLSTSHIL